jgi:lipoprotein-releasing system permease protein
VVGCLVGTLLGITISLNLTDIVIALETFFNVKVLSGDVYFIDFLPTNLSQNDVVATVVTALTMSLLATLYPAWQATKVQPAQVLGQM